MDRLSLPQEGKYKTYLFFYYLSSHRASHMVLVVKNPPTNAGDLRDTGSIPRLRRHPVEGHGNPLQYSCLENPMDRGDWWAIVHGVAKSQTRLKQLSTQPLIIFPTKNRLNKS